MATRALTAGNRVHGAPGVFYADRAASGEVLNLVAPDCVHVLLDGGDKAVVPISTLTKEA